MRHERTRRMPRPGLPAARSTASATIWSLMLGSFAEKHVLERVHADLDGEWT